MNRIFLRLLAVLLCAALLASCSPQAPEPSSSEESSAPSSLAPAPEEPEPDFDIVFSPDHTLSPEETIAAYFEQTYLSYINMVHIDISVLFDLSLRESRRTLIWLETLALRRRLIWEMDYCYVETGQHPYRIEYVEELEDERMSFWEERELIDEGEVLYHFNMVGEPGAVYPPSFAMNGQHTIFLKEIDGVWKITLHYFPGFLGKIFRLSLSRAPTEEEMREMLEEEFHPDSAMAYEDVETPEGAFLYDSGRAVEYAVRFAESRNPAFYSIRDWMGNCANYLSQCIWYGFGEGDSVEPGAHPATASWFGGDGGTPAWENVDYFWNDIMEPGGLTGQRLGSIWEMQAGDIVQTQPKLMAQLDPDDYSHMLMLIGPETMLFAQNSPDTYIYYSDLFDSNYRMVRPLYLSE